MTRSLDRQPRGTILIVVLVVIMLISVVAYNYTLSMQTENIAAASHGDHLVARQAAWSAIDWFSAILEAPMSQRQSLLERETLSRSSNGILLTREQTRDQLSGPRFLVTTDAAVLEGPLAIDESTKIHLGMLVEWDAVVPGSGRETLLRIPGMTPEIADGILDWIDADSNRRDNGAEAADYERWQPRNGLPMHLEELLLVQGVQESLGDRRNQAPGIREDNTPANLETILQTWKQHLTLYSAEKNRSRDGFPRIFLNHSDLALLYQQLVERMPLPWAQFIILYRQYGASTTVNPEISFGELSIDLNQIASFPIKNILDLLDGSVTFTQGGKTVNIPSPFRSDPGLMPTQLLTLCDMTTTTNIPRMTGRININRAPPHILLAIPGLDPSIVERIMAARSIADGGSMLRYHPIWLLTEGIVSPQQMRSLMPYLNTGGDVYWAEFIGQATETSSLYRCEAVIDASGQRTQRVFFRELSPIKWARFNDFTNRPN